MCFVSFKKFVNNVLFLFYSVRLSNFLRRFLSSVIGVVCLCYFLYLR